jgi:ribosomal protein S4
MGEIKKVNPEEVKARIKLRQKIYYQTHKRKLVESAKKYYQENKNSILKSNKKSPRKKKYDTLYYANHKAEILAKRRYLQEQKRLKNKLNGISA